MDKAEVYGPLRERLWLTVILVGALLLGTSTAVGFMWRQQRIRSYRERAKAAEALRESEEKFRSFFELSADLGFIADIDGYFRVVNASFQRVLGYAEEEILGKPFLSFVHPDDRDKTTQIIAEKLQRGEPVLSFENRYRHKDGSIVWLEWTSQPLAAKGITFAIARDITERKRGEEGLQRALADLERSNKELEQFAYAASHDLQEPLRMVASYTQLLAERYQDRLDDKAKKYIDYAVDGAVRMQRLINDLLTYSRIGTRGRPLEPTDSHSALGEAIKNLAVAIEENRAIITHDDLPAVRADASQLVQVFQNLISNSIKFRGKDIPRIHVSAKDQGRDWVFSIRDNGVGIDPQYADKVFLIFQRLHTREEYPGTGIGLAVCNRIVERHGGKIWFESEPGKGSTFFFAIPK
jgi:PAS domain S-box-containing protein